MSDWTEHLIGLANLESNAGKKVAFETSAEKIGGLEKENQQLKQRIEQLEKSNTHEALRVMLQKANAKIKQLERERDEFKETARQYTTLASKGIYHSLEELAQLKIEQQIKALNELVDWAYEVPEREFTTIDIMNRSFELDKQLRKGGE